jgi:hypothetical protein
MCRRAAQKNHDLSSSTIGNGDISETDPINAAIRSHFVSGISSLRRADNIIRTVCRYSSKHESAWKGRPKIPFL